MTSLIIAVVSFLAGGGLAAFLFISTGRKLGGIQAERNRLDAERSSLDAQRSQVIADAEIVQSRKISIADLERENEVLKRDLRNIDTSVRKLDLDREAQATRQEDLDRRAQELAERYLKETEMWVSRSIGANNYGTNKSRLTKAVEWCRSIGFEVTTEREEQLLADLKADFEKAVRVALEREEQARIKARIREEQAREREIEKELKTLEREREAIQAALEKALAETQDQHSAEVDRLRERLADAETRNQRAISQAQLTKSGHIYVISNIGSFGEGVVKIGMTRRLEPLDRVKELGDASVPFPFDVHMMISCDDAPTLENQLHRHFHQTRINKVNPRKEYFRVELETIRVFVQEHHGEVDYVADPEALEFRQSQDMSEDDQQFIDSVFEHAAQDLGLADVED